MAKKFDIDEMRGRLREAIKASGRSDRSIGIACGFGAGYIHSILSEGKEPGVARLAAICEEIGASFSYVMYGFDVSPEREELLQAVQENPGLEKTILDLMKSASQRS